ncbi:hypothetical protein BOTBODRAFT_49917 [Botryobasidium botryosum FD-172 SS1]|uniref:Uncharacterized protein n=1 Tax=Botryobasidium botryosum (strain FD-172 SS1) TaxID=930990 RepID=A0A067N2R8_BOTB1|nr:hypothetical protein BOTBODRAFT_49917 [Botryobasidium botryosum FD-172 SS1]
MLSTIGVRDNEYRLGVSARAWAGLIVQDASYGNTQYATGAAGSEFGRAHHMYTNPPTHPFTRPPVHPSAHHECKCSSVFGLGDSHHFLV